MHQSLVLQGLGIQPGLQRGLQSFVTPAPMGPWIAGLKCHVLTSHHPRSAVELRGFWFHAQIGGTNFTFTCRNVSRAFGRAFTIEMLGIYLGFAKKENQYPRYSRPRRGRGNK